MSACFVHMLCTAGEPGKTQRQHQINGQDGAQGDRQNRFS